MVISLDSEISHYEPFGRSVISSIPNYSKSRSQTNKPNGNNNEDNDDLLEPSSEFIMLANNIHNDFTTAELDTTRDLFRSINDVSISKDGSLKEFWKIRKCFKGEEELYIKENTVICSYKQSNNCGTSFLDKTFTFNEKIIDAVWCDFLMSDNVNALSTQDLSNIMFKSSSSSDVGLFPKFCFPSPNIDSSSPSVSFNDCGGGGGSIGNSSNKNERNITKSLCILDKYSIHILSESGDHYRKALQFEVNKMVATNYGLLLERAVNNNENSADKMSSPYPLMFTLSNPLNEIVPVLLVGTGNNQKMMNCNNIGYVTQLNHYKLVAVVEEKNLVIFYCSDTNCHMIFYLRQINAPELNWIQYDLQKTSDKDMLMEVDKIGSSDVGTSLNLVSTPVSNCDSVKKFTRLSYPSNTSSPITRSMSSNVYCNFVQTGSNSVSRNSSPRAPMLTCPTVANISSPHNSRQSLPNNDISIKRVLSPSTTKLSSLFSSRIDSPVSPSLNRFHVNTNNATRLSDSEIRFNLQHTQNGSNDPMSKTSKSSTNAATPTIMRNCDTYVQKFSEPIIAEYTLEFVWSESINALSSNQGQFNGYEAASKVFVTSDFLGQFYLCLLIKESKNLLQTNNSSLLKLIKFDQTSSSSSSSSNNADSDMSLSSNRLQYIFGTTKVLEIKDAEPLDSLNMIIVLDNTNALILYSGSYKVAIVHLQPSVSVSTDCLNSKLELDTDPKTLSMTPNLSKSVLKFTAESPNFDDFLCDPMGINSKSLKLQTSSPISTTAKIASYPINPFHSSDLSMLRISTDGNSKVTQNMDESLPFSIEPYPAFGKIVTLRDSIDNRVTFETNDGNFYRLSFPLMASTFLVDKCLAALRQTFPKDIAKDFITAWYSYRNSNKDENIPEIVLFKLCLLTLIGYDKESIKEDYNFKNEIACPSMTGGGNINSRSVVVNSPVEIGHSETLEKEITKKMKIEDDYGKDDDWYSLISNCTNLYGLNKADLIDDLDPSDSSTPDKCSKRTHPKSVKFFDKKCKYSFGTPGILFPCVPNILYTLHLIYEDLKLVQMNWPLCKSIVDILYLFSVDLNLSKFQDYYNRDFPSICAEIDVEIDRYSLENKSKLTYPSYFVHQPPSIYRTLYSLLSNNLNTATMLDIQNNEKDSIFFPYIGSGGSVSKTLTLCGSHIITTNIFNLMLLYSNLNQNELVDPQMVLQCIGNNLFLNSHSQSAYINIEKFRQIFRLYSNPNLTTSSSADSSLANFSIKKNNNRKSQRISDIQRLLTEQRVCNTLSKNRTERRDSQEKILFLMSALGITQDYLKQLPFGLALPLWNVIFNYRMNPKNDWCSSIYFLIDRPDLLSLEFQDYFSANPSQSTATEEDMANVTEEDESELSYLDYSVLRLLFPSDQRLQEAYRMLTSSKPVDVAIQQAHGVSDHDFVEEQEKHLFAVSIRTMALPLGRGMVTLRSYTPVVAERFPIPPLALHGKVPPRNTIVEMAHIDVPPNMNIWPMFHNGVSAGLRISSNPNKMVDSSWILFNKPANNTFSDEHYAHAGFLLALGLNGLLDNLSIMDYHEYLSKGNDLTKVAILLGLAASKRGSMDSSTFTLLGIHLEGLLPSTSTELDVSPIVKVAAVLGVGLLFQGTGHSYIAEVMLNEIGRPPGPEMEHYIDLESYALSAGLAFGLVTLGRGNEMISTVSSEGISIPDQLNDYMIGVHKKLSTIQKEKNKPPSYHIREGDCINADVTSPGATLALGMMFFNTSNKAIAQWLNVPDTQNLLEMVRPDFILLRVLAKNLIMWSDIKPVSEWIESHIPSIIYKNAFQKVSNVTRLPNEMMQDDIDYETMTQSYCNIIAGACFALALRFAGSADSDAFDVVKKYTVKLITLIQKGTTAHIEQAGRSTIESCVNVLIVSCSIIMAGTGNVEVMRLCRYLRSRINQNHVLYGSFMANHMALGLLFLGGCRITLNSSPESVAALICAFFPKYPNYTSDNRYHLQAFRHLYVLATEPRLLIPRCIDTGTPVYATIRYRLRNLTNPNETKLVEKLAPCLLPDLNLLETVDLIDNNYWNISFEWNKNFIKLRKCLKFNGNLFIKRKVKCLSYNKEFIYNTNSSESNDSTDSFQTMFHKIDRKSFTLFDFTNEVILKTFSQVFISNNLNSEKELLIKNRLCSILYDCAEDETLELFAPLIKLISSCSMLLDLKVKSLHQISEMLDNNTDSRKSKKFDDEINQQSFHKYFTLWQIKFASLFIDQSRKKLPKFKFIETIRFQIEQILKKSVDKEELKNYLTGQVRLAESSDTLIDTVVYYDLPAGGIASLNDMKFLELLKYLRTNSASMSTGTALFLYNLLKSQS